MSDVPVLIRLIVLRDPRLPFVDLDLTDPETGAPLREICLIGPNGSGKSALLARLQEAMTGLPRWMESGEAWFFGKFAIGDEELYLAKPFGGGEGHLFRPSIEASPKWPGLATEAPSFEDLLSLFPEDLVLGSSPGFGTSPALWFDAERCLVDGVDAGGLGPFLERIHQSRTEAFHRFLRAPENRDKTLAEVESEFESSSPDALTPLQEAWNRLLSPSGLRIGTGPEGGGFVDSSGSPVSPVRLGAVLQRTLYQAELAATHPSGSLFLDGAGDGLHPALALGLVALFRSLAGTAPPRLVMTTQCPLVASGFAPGSRLRLLPGNDGSLAVERGVAPAGAGFEEILRSDFGVTVPPPVRREVSATPAPASSRLKRAIRESEDEEELANLIDEVMSIRNGRGTKE